MGDTAQEDFVKMSSQPLLADLPHSQMKDIARHQIERLVRQRLLGRKIDVVSFVEELLAVTTEVGEVTCRRAGDHGLCFELNGSDPFTVDVDGNRGKLRMACARLAVLCQENGHDFMIYGGEGTIRRTAKIDVLQNDLEPLVYHLLWKARWSNTTDKHEFTISVAR
jgi:hypothetical protein